MHALQCSEEGDLSPQTANLSWYEVSASDDIQQKTHKQLIRDI